MKFRWLALKFEPRDMWIGIYWTCERHFVEFPTNSYAPAQTVQELTLYVCPLPMLLLKFRIYYDLQ